MYATFGNPPILLQAGGSMAPSVEQVAPSRMQPNSTATFTLTGGAFSAEPMPTVKIDGEAVDPSAVRYLDHGKLEVDYTADGSETTHDVQVCNESACGPVYSGAFVVQTSTWLDLRSNGSSLTMLPHDDANVASADIVYRSGMTPTRTTDGLTFAGLSPWSSVVEVPALSWTRGDDRTLHMILSSNSASMFGVRSDQTDFSNTAQYAQGENQLYVSSATNIWGYYGNNGTRGSAGNSAQSATIANGDLIKLSIENDGGANCRAVVQKLAANSVSEWNTPTGDLVHDVTVTGSLNPDEQNLLPGWIPTASTACYVAAILVE